MRWGLILLLGIILGGCEEPGTAEFCDGQPVVTYDNFGAGFITENCQSCHASTSTDRQDAPDEITFDSLEEVQASTPLILSLTVSEEPEMPPEGGVDSDGRALLEIWLRCWEG